MPACRGCYALPACRYENTEKRITKVAAKGILYMGMGVSGGEEGARNGEVYAKHVCITRMQTWACTCDSCSCP